MHQLRHALPGPADRGGRPTGLTEPDQGPPLPGRAFAEARARAAASHPVRIIVLGEPRRGDDGVGCVAVREVAADLPPDVLDRVEIRETGQLDPADLVELAAAGGAIVVDAIVGVPAGEVVVLPLEMLAAGTPGSGRQGCSGAIPRSSHVLPVDQLVALAAALRGAPPRGVLVGVGCERFGYGESLSPAVAAAVPLLAAVIRSEIARLLHDTAPPVDDASAPVGDVAAPDGDAS